MRGIFLNVLESNIVVSVAFLLLYLFSGRLRRRYGAGWMKLAWIILAVRLAIPYNFSLPSAPVGLFTLSGIIREEEAGWTNRGTGGNDGEADRQAGGMAAGKGAAAPDAGDGEGVNAYPGTVITEGIGAEKEAGTMGASDLLITGPEDDTGNRRAESGQASGTDAGRAWQKGALALVRMFPFLWLAGAALCLAYCLIGWGCFWINCRKNLRPVTDIAVRRQVMGLEKKLMGKASIPVYQSRAAKSPMLAGFFGPKLIFPIALADKEEWEKRELNLIVAHEVFHYTHKDLWLKLLMTFVWCVNWFNPLIWMMKKQFFYELELACDECVLSGCDEELREAYARMMLSFAREKKGGSAFSTGFGENKKQMKERIDYMLDIRGRKRGTAGIILTGIMVTAMGLMVSCGSKLEERNPEEQQIIQETEHDGSGQEDDGGKEASDGDDGSGAQEDFNQKQESAIPYDPNNVYNEMIRYYGDVLFIARQDGIYRLSDGREELVYANSYWMRRGMEIYQDGLYFCGSSKSGEQEGHNIHIYRMDLATYEVEDLFALFSQVYDALYDITVIDGKLYVTSGYFGTKMGFELSEDGRITKTLDEEAEDYLYREDNDYWNLQRKIFNNEVTIGSEEYVELTEKASGMYRGAIDLAACQKMLDGDQVVMKYKDELLSSIYLKKPDGNYEFLCDAVAAYPILVTETGVYYPLYEGSAIWYVDYETKTQRKIWEEDSREWKEIQLANYDRDYLYFTSKRFLGRDQEGVSVHEIYLMRIPRWEEGKAEKVYRFEDGSSLGSLQRKCAVADGKMFFEDHETITLDPDANGMGPENNGEPSKDGAAMRQVVETFAKAYFQNDEETLRGYLAEGFEGNPDFYPYPQQAGEMEGQYIAGVPEGDVPVGVICYVSYEFSGNAETEDAYSYLSMEMEKTGQGWKVLSYGLEG